MISHPPWEFRLEVYADGALEPAVAQRIGALLAERWPITWDVKVPTTVTMEHPARWHAVLALGGSETPAKVHRQIALKLHEIDPQDTLRYRSRWAFPQTPNEQEVFEERWDLREP